jgi:hypothetical protein
MRTKKRLPRKLKKLAKRLGRLISERIEEAFKECHGISFSEMTKDWTLKYYMRTYPSYEAFLNEA